MTGGASGLGRATAERLLSKGSRIVICDLPTSNGSEVAKQLGENVLFIPADVSSEKQVEDLVKEAVGKFGKIDAAINCAGISFGYEIYNFNKDMPGATSDFLRVYEVNACGTFNVTKACVPHFVKNEPDEYGHRGIIVNTTSSQAFHGVLGQAGFAAASAAIMALTKSTAREFSPHGIRCAAIAVGIADTPLTESIPNEVKEIILDECMDFPNAMTHPDQFAHLVQTILSNSSLNSTTIDMSCGLHISV